MKEYWLIVLMAALLMGAVMWWTMQRPVRQIFPGGYAPIPIPMHQNITRH